MQVLVTGDGDIISVMELLDTAVSLQQARASQEEDRLEVTTSFLATWIPSTTSVRKISHFTHYTAVK